MQRSKKPYKQARTPGPMLPPSAGQNRAFSSISSANKLGHLSAAGELEKLASGVQRTVRPIDFGKPPNQTRSSGPTTANTSAWSGLIHTAVTHGSSQPFGGGLLGSGISTLFSAIFNSFGGGGGKSEQPALQPFLMAGSQQRTVFVSPAGILGNHSASATYQGGSPPQTQNSNHPLSIGQADIVKAVKNALLTSSSLNDVIGEL